MACLLTCVFLVCCGPCLFAYLFSSFIGRTNRFLSTWIFLGNLSNFCFLHSTDWSLNNFSNSCFLMFHRLCSSFWYFIEEERLCFSLLGELWACNGWWLLWVCLSACFGPFICLSFLNYNKWVKSTLFEPWWRFVEECDDCPVIRCFTSDLLARMEFLLCFMAKVYIWNRHYLGPVWNSFCFCFCFCFL